MNRSKRKKERSLMEELKEQDLIEKGEPVDIPDLENDDLIEESSMSVIVRCLNPAVHKVGGLVKALPPIWDMEDRVRGRGVGEDRAQFIFQNDRDLQHVLTRGPWFVNTWIVALDQWKPNPGPDFLNLVPFWIRIRGIPIHLIKKTTVESLISTFGRVEKVELHTKNSDSLEYVRAHAWVKADEPIQFRKMARFKSGESALTELEYEKLLKVCFICKRLTHDQNSCPYQIQEAEPTTRRRRAESVKGNTFNRTTGTNRGKGTLSEDRRRDNLADSTGPICLHAQTESFAGRRSAKERLGWKSKGKGKVDPIETQVWKIKDAPEACIRKAREMERESTSRGESVHSTQGKQKSGEKESLISSSKEPGTHSGSRQSPSVFQRLSSNLSTPITQRTSNEKDTENKQSGSVFERLGDGSGGKEDSEQKVLKRRRLSPSDNRESKRVRKEEPLSVFQRLGESSSGSKRSGSGSGSKREGSGSGSKSTGRNNPVVYDLCLYV